jgi:hypothetical protein
MCYQYHQVCFRKTSFAFLRVISGMESCNFFLGVRFKNTQTKKFNIHLWT